MGFSGGGSNILKPHSHNGLTVQDGGALNFNNITQSGSSAGQVFYSDGVHLQQLAYPGVPGGELLTAAAASSAPTWVAATPAGAVMELVDFTRVAVTTNTIDTSFAAIDRADISELLCFCSGANGNQNIGLQINGVTTGYATQGSRYAAGVETIINTSAQTGYDLITAPPFSNSHFAVFHIMASNNNGNVDGDVCIMSQVSGATAYETSGGICTTNTGSFTSVKIGITASNTMEAGSWLSIYKVLNS